LNPSLPFSPVDVRRTPSVESDKSKFIFAAFPLKKENPKKKNFPEFPLKIY